MYFTSASKLVKKDSDKYLIVYKLVNKDMKTIENTLDTF